MRVQGWVDLQINGYAGIDFNAPGLTIEAVKTVTDRLVADGTAAFLPTLVTGESGGYRSAGGFACKSY